MKRITFLITALGSLLLFGSLSLQAQTLTVSSGSGAPNGAVGLTLSVSDNTDGIAGAAFTITYDTDLTLNSITSPGTPFFDTFTTMGVGTTVTVGTETYSQAVVTNGAAVAAANAANKTGNHVLFNLNFTVNGGATAGAKPVGIQATVIENAAAGYTTPTAIPMLVGILSGTPDTYPERSVSVVAGAITVSAASTDTDNDGIEDQWEIDHFGDLTTANSTSDFDKDGYTDKQEFDNGGAYDPKVFNAPGGTGYNGLTDNDWIMLDPVGAENIIAFRDGIVADFGADGLGYFDGSAWTMLHNIDAGIMTSSDMDSDGIDELAVFFQGYGIYIWDGSWSVSPIASFEPENMIAFGNSIAIDFGAAYGLYTYNTTDLFVQILSLDASIMTEADVDADGTMELAVYFSGYGIYIYDGSWSATPIATTQPEQMIEFGNAIAIDFGTAYGLYTYSTAGGFSQIHSVDATSLAAVDTNQDGTMELAAHLNGYGVYIFNGTSWNAQVTANQPQNMVGVGSNLVMDFGTSGISTFTTASGIQQIATQDAAMMVANQNVLYCTFPGTGLFSYTFQQVTARAIADTLLMNFPTYGLYTYETLGGFTNIQTFQAPLSVTADIDSDGVDEIISFIEGYGLYVFDDGAWGPQITNIKPDAMIRFGNSVALDYGAAYGLYTYDTTSGFTLLTTLDPSHLAEADVDNDGAMELAVYFAGYGIYIWDNGFGAPLTIIEPENVVPFGNGIALDFGSVYGLYTYNTTDGFIQITGMDAGNMQQADIDNDGAYELAASFTGQGVFIYDGSWGPALTPAETENMVQMGNSLALDFGSVYGLYTYSSGSGFTMIHNLDPTTMTEVDVDNDSMAELAVYFSGYGVYIYDAGWGPQITPFGPDLMTSASLR